MINIELSRKKKKEKISFVIKIEKRNERYISFNKKK